MVPLALDRIRKSLQELREALADPEFASVNGEERTTAQALVTEADAVLAQHAAASSAPA